METSNPSNQSETRAAFHLLCARLIVFGADKLATAPAVRPADGPIREAARRIQGAWEKAYRESRVPELKTIEAWATKSLPHSEAFGRLCRMIFGESHDGHAVYRQFNALWKAARARTTSPTPQTDLGTSEPASPQGRAAGVSFRDLAWTPVAQPQPDGLLELIVHRPTFDNEDPETARLPVTLSFDRIEDSVTHNKKRYDLRLGLTRAELRPDWVNCQPGFRSRPGQNAERASNGNVEVRAGVFHITGPRKGGPVLVGDPFDGDPACTLEPAGKGEPRVSLTLASSVNDVDVAITRGNAPAETMKAKLAKAWLLQRKTKVEDGRTVIWSKASLRGRKRS